MAVIKENSWLNDIIEAFNLLDGEAKYKDLYPQVQKIRKEKNRTWPATAEQTIQGIIENNSSHSKNLKRSLGTASQI